MRGVNAPMHSTAVASADHGLPDGKVDDDSMGAFLGALDRATAVAAKAGQRAAKRLKRQREAVIARASSTRHGSSRADTAQQGMDSALAKELERTAFFDASKKQTAIELRKRSEAVLAKNSFQITTIGVGTSAATLSTNSKLLRQEPPLDKDRWDRYAPFRKPRETTYKPKILP